MFWLKTIDMDEIKSRIALVLSFGFLSFLTLWAAKFCGFFRLLRVQKEAIGLTLKQVLTSFAIYLGVSFLSLPAFQLIKAIIMGQSAISTTQLTLVQLFILSLIALFLTLYFNKQNRFLLKRIWKNRSHLPRRSLLQDFLFGVTSWLVSFPLVVFSSELCDLIILHFFGGEHYEQVAVRYLKTAFYSPELITVALLTIVFLAPAVEEFLFRGLLQTWLKQHVGAKAAILLGALCFALLHFSLAQGLGNISLLISLFVFAYFLGFIYERQGSLFAAIALHMTFNAVSAIRILLTT